MSDDWDTEKGVTCVVCPKCAFTFDACHADEGGGYSCPACAELAQEATIAQLRAEKDALRLDVERLDEALVVTLEQNAQLREALDRAMLSGCSGCTTQGILQAAAAALATNPKEDGDG